MSPTRLAIQWPVAVIAGVLLVLLFGLLALYRIPVQLTPDVRKPVITIETSWPGASPWEVEREITLRQEEVLKGLPGLVHMTSSSNRARTKVTLEFASDTDMDSALVMVSNRLERIRNFPEEAQRPVLQKADSDDSPIVWMMIRALDPEDRRDIADQADFVEETVRPVFERIPGVAVVNVMGGRERELRITIDPTRMAARGISIGELTRVLKQENVDVSADILEEGKRAYLIRTLGRFTDPAEVEKVAIRPGPEGRVLLGEIATVSFALQDPAALMRTNGRSSIGVNCVREHGGNVLTITAEVVKAIGQLNDDVLHARGLHMALRFSQTDYIEAAIRLVKESLLTGSVLAVALIFYALRSFSATLVIAIAIPVCTMGAFLTMALLGRSLNVVSLAGLAFAAGMVVDPAIVVLENIVRMREGGLPKSEAALLGTTQVWGANLLSTLTTVAVFLPLLSLKIEAAQLFGDIAIALCAAVLISLVVSTTVIPAFTVRLMREKSTLDANVGQGFADAVARFVGRVNGSLFGQWLMVGGIGGGCVFLTLGLLPPAEYLPEGNRNLVTAMLLPPPGYNLQEMTRMAEGVETTLKPYWDLTPGQAPDNPEQLAFANFFFVARGAVAFMGGMAREPERAREIIPVFRKATQGIPGTIPNVNQTSIFQRGLGQGRGIDLTLTGPDLDGLIALARRLYGLVQQAIPDAQVRPMPGLELANPEIQVLPNRVRARDNGLSTLEIGQTVDAYVRGLKVDDVIVDGREMDLVIRGEEGVAPRTSSIQDLPVVTPGGVILPLSSVAEVVHATGPIQIDHYERERSVALRVSPPREMPLETAARIVREEVIDAAQKEGLPPLTRLRLTEGADQLFLAKKALGEQFLLASAITFLLMAALFNSFLYPAVILITLPLATAGGMLGLKLLNLFTHQPMDVLTMLGFVILVGVVVNNGILIVHQALHFMREEGMDPDAAVVESTRIRVRPILLTTMTSVLGMLPLVVMPGAGSELYRGLGSVVAGGLAFATLLTLITVPPCFAIFLRLERGWRRLLARRGP